MAVRLEIHSNIEDAMLQSYFRDVGGHALYIHSLWSALYGQSRAFHLVLKDEEVIAGLSLAIENRQKKMFFLKGEKELSIPFAPIVKNNDRSLICDFFNEIVMYAKRGCYNRLAIEWRYGNNICSDIIGEFTNDVEYKIEFLIDLQRGEEELMGSYFTGKSKYKKALKDGLHTEVGASWEDLLDLRSMQIKSSSRAAERDNIYNVPDEEYYKKIYDACIKPGYSRIIFAKKGGKRISGLMFLIYAGRAVVQRGGSTDEAFPLGASRFLHYALIQYLKKSGCRDVFFGGVPAGAVSSTHPEHGLYLFKKGFPAIETAAFTAKIAL